MPTYEYECEKCGHRFERFQRMSEPPEKRCPECKGPVRRLIGAGAGILFKGDGFYVTDYRSKEYQEKAKAESNTKKGDAEKPAKETKSEPTSPPAPKSPGPDKKSES